MWYWFKIAAFISTMVLLKWGQSDKTQSIYLLPKFNFGCFRSNFFFHRKGFVLFCNIKLMRSFFTFFYVCRRKYWFRKNIWLLVFDGFTRFGMSWTGFDYFGIILMSVCLCVCKKRFVASVDRELIDRIAWNFIFRVILK